MHSDTIFMYRDALCDLQDINIVRMHMQLLLSHCTNTHRRLLRYSYSTSVFDMPYGPVLRSFGICIYLFFCRICQFCQRWWSYIGRGHDKFFWVIMVFVEIAIVIIFFVGWLEFFLMIGDSKLCEIFR